MKRTIPVLLAAFSFFQWCSPARAVIVDFFDASQSFSLVQSGTTSDTVSTEGYLFTYTRDKLFTGGLGGGPIGRSVRIDWPVGLEAQAVTTGPVTGPAQFTIQRVDGDVFDMPAFTARLLGNTAASGAAIEIMPKLNGEDGFPDPVMFQASGYYGSSFSYDTTTPGYLGDTSTLVGFESYQVSIFVDFALTAVQVEGNVVPEPASAILLLCGLALLSLRRRPRSRF